MNLNFNPKLNFAAAKISVYSLIVLCGFSLAAAAQSFSSGSDGSDGALDLSGTPGGTTVTFVPTNYPGDQHALGIYNFTYINIPNGVTVRLSALHLPGPVYWLASGDVLINGTLDLSGANGYGQNLAIGGRIRQVDAGAGGFPGGMGANSAVATTASPGDGPGGGTPGGISAVGTNTSNSFLVPLIGGSGGAGYYNSGGDPLYFGGGGGAGGGAILIASSTSITINGQIDVQGGSSGEGYGYGASGSIHLVTNTIAGSGFLNAGAAEYSQSAGVVRIEAFNSSSSFNVTGNETSDTPLTALILPKQPQASIKVVSVNSTAVPANPTGSVSSPDVILNTSSAATVTVQATNIPVGTVVTLHLYSDNTSTDQTVQTTPLAGTLASSTATANVTFPSGYSLNYVKATWTGSY